MTWHCILVLSLYLGSTLASPVKASGDSQEPLAQSQQAGRLVFPDELPKELEILRARAEQGDTEAQFNFALLIWTENKSEAIRWLRTAAKQGNEAARNLLVAYEIEEAVAHYDRGDYLAAFPGFRSGAARGDATAQLFLGIMYVLGRGVSKDDREAVRWYKAAAEQGNSSAQHLLAVHYASGQGITKNEREAAKWYRAAAEQGNADAQFKLGAMLAIGQGIPKDEREAVRWYRAAAVQGNVMAQNNLGVMLIMGLGAPKDDREAVRWFRAAAEQGDADAQNHLGTMLTNGIGVPKDDQTAYFWFLLSSGQGNEASVDKRDHIERRLTPQQRAAAQAAARDWQPRRVSASASPESATQPAPTAAAVEPESTGTAFRVARNVFVTNHHVIEHCRRVEVDGTAAKVLVSDPRTDLALISAAVSGPVATLRSPRSLVGEALTVAGFPLQGLLSGFQVTTGTLASLSGIGRDTSQFQLTAPVQPGNSGGPVLDTTGRVMGVVVSKLNAIRTARMTGDIPQNVNFAIGTNALRAFLDANGVDYQIAAGGRPVPTTTIAQQAQGYTVRLECWR